MRDQFRTKVIAAEDKVWASAANIALERGDVLSLVDEFCTARASGLLEVRFSDEGKLALRRESHSLEVPPWSLRPLLLVHHLAHWATSPVFPPHGAEFAACLVTSLHRFASPQLGDELSTALDAEGVHRTVDERLARMRKEVVAHVNGGKQPLVELALDDPPELLTGNITGFHDELIVMGDVEVPFERARYVQRG